MNTLENPTLYREIKSGAYSVLHFFLFLLERKVLVLARTPHRGGSNKHNTAHVWSKMKKYNNYQHFQIWS